MTHSNAVNTLLQQLTLAEKATLCSGADFWHVPGIERLQLPAIMLTDGPHGVRKLANKASEAGLSGSVPATCFPTASGLAATWNCALTRAIGVALGQECLAEQVSVLLGPGINIKRNPLGGRNFEYFSEDPYLAGALACAWIGGVQSQGVGTSLKHFAVNNHESGRMVVDAIVDERTLREIYLPAFEICVKQEQPWTIMCSYNKLNGTYLSEHAGLLSDILCTEWGFKGLVVSDWGAVNDRVLGLKNGLQLEMPSSGTINTQRIIDAVECGELSLAELDGSVAKVLTLSLRAQAEAQTRDGFDLEAHHALARQAAEEVCVLLKNDGPLLPLQTDQSVAVLGALAVDTRYQGSGSSQINPTRLEQPLAEIQRLSRQHPVHFAAGYNLHDDQDDSLIAEAVAIAVTADRVVLIAGLPPEYESEGFDRQNLQLPAAQLRLIEALAPVHHKLIIVLQNGAPVDLPFADRVPALIEAYLGGQAGASALANILFGQANPSGKLAETFPLALADIPSQPWFPGLLRQSQYREGIWVGYRYFDSAQVAVRFPFGHGLSYTRFDYSDLQVSHELSSTGQPTVRVTFTLTNSGDRHGAEVAQLYVGQLHSSVYRPAKELQGFTKVELDPGAHTRVSLELPQQAFAFWSVEQHDWVVENDTFSLSIGASVADIRLQQTLELTSGQAIGVANPALRPYALPAQRRFDDAAFSALLGHPIPLPVPTQPYQLNSTIVEVRHHWLGRLLQRRVAQQVAKLIGPNASAKDKMVMEAMFFDMPLRNMLTMSQGNINQKTLNRLIHLLNGNWLQALRGSAVLNR
jgi:beta-glucosidase